MNEEIEKILHQEELHLASISKRSLAFFLDELFLSFLLIVAIYDKFVTATDVEQVIALTNSFVLEYMIIKIIYQTFFVMQYGATLGKIVTKIRVVELSTLDDPSFASALNRAVFRIISEALFYLGFLWGMMDPVRQTWHDKTARTIVVDA